jgi:hypothetical protein
VGGEERDRRLKREKESRRESNLSQVQKPGVEGRFSKGQKIKENGGAEAAREKVQSDGVR